jgi:endonuclease/exonuclease/phosphatase family metal-dependent hydrolase
MIRPFLKLGWLGMLALATLGAHAQTQATLGTSPYIETFDNLASGLPTGFNLYTAASATSLGMAATSPVLTPSAAAATVATSTQWAASGGNFKNFASNTALSSTATADMQAMATDRALGVRQTGSFGDGSGATGAGPAFAFQIANTTGKTDFALSFKLQSLDNSTNVGRTATWRVDYGLGATPSAFTQVGSTATTSSAFSNTTITASFGGALDNQGGPVWVRIVAPAVTTGSGSRPSSAIDGFTLTWQTNSTAPQLAAAPAALAFGNQAINTTSAAQTYTLTGSNLTANATVTATAPFSVSKDNVTYGLTATYTAAELATGPKPVYVKFTPTTSSLATGPATGTITNSSVGAATRTVTATGAGVDPTQTVYSFNGCVNATNLSDGWLQYSVTGAQTWACTTFGRDPNAPTGTAAYPTAVQMNGYANNANVTNEDWLISPALALTTTTYPLLSFWSRTAFAGPQLRLLLSTNYSGTGSPVAPGVTWTDLNATFPTTGSDTWTQTANLDLSAYKMAGVYVAFVYNSNTDEAARWTLDDVVLTNSATPAPPTVRATPGSLSFGYRAPGTTTLQTLNVTATNLTGDLTVTSSNAAFQLSKDGASFGSTVTYSTTEASGKIVPVRVRFQPTVAATTYAGTATVATAGAASQSLALSGNTYDVANTLEVVNWNMEWFGSPASGFGPDDKDLQYANASSVLRQLDADVFALIEVVDTLRLNTLVKSMPGYAYRVSDFGSAADNNTDPDYPLTQKLAFVYRTSVVSNPQFTSFFRTTQTQSPSYSAWSSGRFPFVMQADVTVNGVTKPVTFVAIHAKANTAPLVTSYERRKSAATELKAKLDAEYAGRNVVVLGDFNDDLDQTITAGIAPPITSYSAFTADANYPSPTLQELSLTGQKSTVGYNDVIDHVVTSKVLYDSYIKGTAEIQTGVTSTIANYGSTTSDHYPVLTRYAFVPNNLFVNTLNQAVPAGTYNNITVASTGQGTLQGPVVVTGTVAVQGGGRLDTNCQPITGSGNFVVADGATLSICDAAGIAATGSTGAVQVTGIRSFSMAASYVYNGTTTQVTGLGLPSQVRDLTTTNTNSLTLSQPLVVAQTLTVASSGNVVLNNQPLTLLSNAVGTALVVNSGSGTVQGPTAIVQRYLDGSRNASLGYRQLAAPVSGSTVDDLTTAAFKPVVNSAYNSSAQPNAVQPFPTVYGYDETRLVTTTNNSSLFDKGWYSPASLTDALTVGKGYTVNLGANQVVDFVGTLNNGDYSQTLTRQSQTSAGGWQLVGNPYPAPLDYLLVTAADRPGLDAAMHVSQSTGQYANTYRSYVNGVGNPVIPVGQGFFMRVAAGQSRATLLLRNSQRSTSYATQVAVQRITGETRPRLNLTLTAANGSADALYVYAESGATPGFDSEQDAAKLPNATGLNLAALTSDGQPLSIQGLAALTGRVALRLQVPAAGTYSLTAAELLNLPAGTQPVLEDTKTGQRTSLTAAGTAYTFTVAAGEPTDGRFWLRLNGTDSPLATTNPLQTELALYPNPTREGQATLLVPTGTGAGQVQVLDALGRLVREQALVVGGATTLKLAGLPAGMYLVRVQAGSEQATRRLTIN